MGNVMMLTKQNRKDLPPLYSQDSKGEDAKAVVKFFTPDAQWTWYATEFDGEDIFFGLVVGQDIELGYFSLSELRKVRGGLGLPVERDRHFEPKTLRECRAKHEPQGNSRVVVIGADREAEKAKAAEIVARQVRDTQMQINERNGFVKPSLNPLERLEATYGEADSIGMEGDTHFVTDDYEFFQSEGSDEFEVYFLRRTTGSYMEPEDVSEEFIGTGLNFDQALAIAEKHATDLEAAEAAEAAAEMTDGFGAYDVEQTAVSSLELTDEEMDEMINSDLEHGWQDRNRQVLRRAGL